MAEITPARLKAIMTFTDISRTNKLRQCLLIASLWLLATLPAVAESCWKIAQYCEPIGTLIIYVSPTALKIHVLETGSTILAQAPAWEIYYFNKDTHRLAKCSIEGWHGTPSSRMVELQEDVKVRQRWRSTGIVTYEKFNCEHFVKGPRTVDVNGVKHTLSLDEMWCAELLRLTDEERTVMAKFYGYPRQDKAKGPGRVALFITLRKADDEKMEFLRTKSCEQVPSKGVFEIPEHYQLIKDDMQVETSKAGIFIPPNP
jgi:hypothetical protein